MMEACVTGAIVLLIFWVVQLIDLMTMTDDLFPGRNDKVLWFIVVFLGSAFGALVFWIWKVIRLPQRVALMRVWAAAKAELVQQRSADRRPEN